MGAELLAGLRGVFGDVDIYAGYPLLLCVVVVAVYFIYRKTA